MKRRVTMNDVAQRAGVSYQTVSRVINNHPRVAESTRARVLQVIEEISYRPNKAAQQLAAHHSKMLAVIATGIEHYGPAQMVINIEQAAKQTGYEIIIRNLARPTFHEMGATLNELSQWRVDGIIIVAAILAGYYDEVLKLTGDIPVVQIDAKPGANTPSLLIDQYEGSRLATQHLIDLGHREIAEIRGPAHWFGAISRHEAWLDTLAAAHLSPIESVAGNWSAASGYQMAHYLLDNHRFTGLVVANDQMALGAIRCIYERGLRVPEDISVVGFDDLPEASYFHPPLTTIRQDFAALGEASLKYMLDIVNHPGYVPEQRLIKPELIIRKSTARADPGRRL